MQRNLMNKTLLEIAVDINVSNEMLISLIKKGENINTRIEKGNTLLHLAIHLRPNLALTLVEMGANLWLQNDNGETPLELAIKKNPKLLIKILKYLRIKKQYINNIFNKAGDSLLTVAVNENADNKVLINLIKSGEDVNTLFPDKNTLLHLAIDKRPQLSLKLILLDADLTLRNKKGETALMISLKKDPQFVLSILRLCQKNQVISSLFKEGDGSLLQTAIQEDNIPNSIFIALIKHGQDIHAKLDHDDNTLLHLTAVNRPLLTLELIKLGAKMTIKNKKDRTPIDVALIYQNALAFKMLALAEKLNHTLPLFYFFIPKTNLTSHEIIEMGESYLQEYGNKPTLLHRHQAEAERMKKFDIHASPVERWLFLADIYKQLHNHRGKLAKSIRGIFAAAYGLYLTDHQGFSVKNYALKLETLVVESCKISKQKPFLTEEIKSTADLLNALIPVDHTANSYSPYEPQTIAHSINSGPTSYKASPSLKPSSKFILDLSVEEINHLVHQSLLGVKADVSAKNNKLSRDYPDHFNFFSASKTPDEALGPDGKAIIKVGPNLRHSRELC